MEPYKYDLKVPSVHARPQRQLPVLRAERALDAGMQIPLPEVKKALQDKKLPTICQTMLRQILFLIFS